MGQTAGQLLMQLAPYQGTGAGREHQQRPFGQQQGARLTKQPRPGTAIGPPRRRHSSGDSPRVMAHQISEMPRRRWLGSR